MLPTLRQHFGIVYLLKYQLSKLDLFLRTDANWTERSVSGFPVMLFVVWFIQKLVLPEPGVRLQWWVTAGTVLLLATVVFWGCVMAFFFCLCFPTFPGRSAKTSYHLDMVQFFSLCWLKPVCQFSLLSQWPRQKKNRCCHVGQVLGKETQTWNH